MEAQRVLRGSRGGPRSPCVQWGAKGFEVFWWVLGCLEGSNGVPRGVKRSQEVLRNQKGVLSVLAVPWTLSKEASFSNNSQ